MPDESWTAAVGQLSKPSLLLRSGGRLPRLLLFRILLFSNLPCFFHHKSAYDAKGIKGDAHAENICSGYILPSQIVTIGALDTGIWIHSFDSQMVYLASLASTLMEASYFYLFVLPLGIFVFLLTALAFYYARREELARRNWRKLMSAYAKKQLKQKEVTDVDDDYGVKLQEALEQLDIVTSENNMHIEENAKSVEADCSEEDAPYSIT